MNYNAIAKSWLIFSAPHSATSLATLNTLSKLMRNALKNSSIIWALMIFFFGHSMGGSIAISLAERYATQIKGIILGEANLDSGGGFFSKKIASYSEEDYCAFGHGEIIKEARENSNGNWAAGLEASSPVAIFREATSLVAGTTPSWRKILYSLDTAKTFIFGEQSLPDPDLVELKMHGVHIELIKNAGHSMAWDNPEGLASAIANAIRYSQ